ncbi:MAG: NAD(P)-dependent oxidoreductase [Clostridium sp.]|nr:NAD(P)-dependent oxidoreductase [Clostridium sp.]
MIKSAVITGASGMLGQALIRCLCKQNIEILAIVRPNSIRNETLYHSESVEVIECDLSELLSIKDKVKRNYDAFFHFGWSGTFGQSRNNLYGQNDNVKYTLDAVELAHAFRCQIFLGAGSQAEYGRVENKKLNSALPAFPETGYGIAKLCAGQMSRLMCKEYGIRHIWTRILSIYGPGDKEHTMVMSGILSMLKGERPQYTKGEQLWDYLYCDDAARAFYLAAEKGKDGSVYCIGSGQVKPLKSYIEQIRDAVNPQIELTFGEVPYYEKQVMYLCADVSELTDDTGFVPQIAFEDGIRRTVEWCKGEMK